MRTEYEGYALQIPDHTPNPDSPLFICTEYIHLYYLIHGFFSFLLPSPVLIFRPIGNFHGSRPQHRHAHPGQWTLYSGGTH